MSVADILMQNSSLLFGDCIERMKELKNDSFDLTLTSPPYNMNLRVNNGKYCSRQIVKEISTKYVDFPDNLSMDDYFNFNVNVINELLRVSSLVFYNVQFLTGNKRALFKLIGHFSEQLKEVIVWDKINAQPAIGQGVLNSQYETILVFDKNSSITRQFKMCNFKRGELNNIWRLKREKKYSKNHGATFPLELANIVISNFSKPNDSILDPFMGLATTGVICERLNRKFTGIEISKHYYSIAADRMIQEFISLNKSIAV